MTEGIKDKVKILKILKKRHIHITRQDLAVLPRQFLTICEGCGRHRGLGTGGGAGELMGLPWAGMGHQWTPMR